MPNEFDPYREALVIENTTIWPDEYDHWEPQTRGIFESRLHAAPAEANELEYVRMHSGFRRQITVTPEDIARLE